MMESPASAKRKLPEAGWASAAKAGANSSGKVRRRTLLPGVIMFLEYKLQRELNLALRSGLWLIARLGNGGERRALGRAAGQIKVRMVGQVEELRPELQPEPLGDRELPINPQVEVLERRALQDVAARVAES